MGHTLLCLGMVSLALVVILAASGGPSAPAQEEADGPLLAHDVYFSLKDNGEPAKKVMVDACRKYLSKHPGEVFFAVGTLAEGLDRPVNDRDFDVALHIVFRSKADHDKYQEDPRHLKFIAENKDNWKKVRVFDSVVTK